MCETFRAIYQAVFRDVRPSLLATAKNLHSNRKIGLSLKFWTLSNKIGVDHACQAYAERYAQIGGLSFFWRMKYKKLGLAIREAAHSHVPLGRGQDC